MSVEHPFLADRTRATAGWNRWRGVISAFYLAAAAFNLAYTLPHSGDDELFEGYAEGAWFGFLGDLVEHIFIPGAPVWMVIVVVFEIAVAALIAHKDRWVDRGVVLSLAWVLAIMPFLAWPYLLVNVGLVVAQGVLLFRSYDRPLWDLRRSSHRDPGQPMIPAGR